MELCWAMKKKELFEHPKQCPNGHSQISWNSKEKDIHCWLCNKAYPISECFDSQFNTPQPGKHWETGNNLIALIRGVFLSIDLQPYPLPQYFREEKPKMKTDLKSKCSSCESTSAEMVQGRIEYFVPWGSSFLCDKCHRLAIMEALYAEIKPLFETPQWLLMWKYHVGKAWFSFSLLSGSRVASSYRVVRCSGTIKTQARA